MDCLILGAGLMQKPAILSAKELGYRVVVIDADKNAVCVPLADEFLPIDLKAKDDILELAKKLQKGNGLAAVFTAGTDFSSSVSYVCERLNLPSHSFEAALNASIKTRMRQCFKADCVPSPSFEKVSKDQINLELINKILNKMAFPLVVKPVDNMGARGCRMVRSEIEFMPALKNAVAASRTGDVIVEEYMEGPEFSIDSIIYNGTMTITGFAERHIYYPPYFIEMGHSMPAKLDKKVHDELISVFALGAKSLGLTCGAAKADIKYTKNGPMIGEIAGRLSGGYMSGWTYPYASDINLTKQGLIIACGKEPETLIKNRIPVDYNPGPMCKNAEKPFNLYEVKCKRTSTERAWISIPGKVKYIENITEYTDKAVFDVLPRATITIGSEVDFPRNNVQKCGNIICVSQNRDIAYQSAEDAVSNVFITLEPANKETDKFLSKIYESDEDKFPPSAFPDFTPEEAQLFEKINENISENQPAYDTIPDIFLSKKYANVKDWNYNTIEQTVKKFDILRAIHPELNVKDFYKVIMRGGLQAAVYYSDSIESEKKDEKYGI